MLDPLNLILMAVAAVVLWKLKSVLGERTGFEKTIDPLAPRNDRPAENDNVIHLPGTKKPEDVKPEQPIWQGFAVEGSDAADGLEKIATASGDFSPQSFLDGAKLAYEMVLEAFAKGDLKALKPLLAADVYDSFAEAVEQRTKAGQTMSMQFVGVKSAKIVHARLEGKKAQLSVEIVGEMISAILDQSGTAIEGDPRHVRDVHDQWTFERDISARDPNWRVTDTTDDEA